MKYKTILQLTLIFCVFNSLVAHAESFQTTETDFKTLFNNYRIGQPEVTPWAGSFFPYSQHGVAVKLDKNGDPTYEGDRRKEISSPAETYDKIFGLKGDASAEAWENDTHTCDKLKGEQKDSCEGWWGHCNAWSAAAIKETEPRAVKVINGVEATVGDQKGILTEFWMGTNSLFAGTTDKSKKTDKWVTENPESPEYKAFWDVTPKTFFMIFTNYIGLRKTGVVIDRFAGEEVWNQPVVGYRILPLRKKDIEKETKNGKSIFTLQVRTKIYWANDLGTMPGHISAPINIEKDTTDEEALEELPHSGYSADYEGRLLIFKLAFDAKPELAEDGKSIKSIGRMLGEGIWYHQEFAKNYPPEALNQTHPDFIWMPTNAFQDYSGYANPNITSLNVTSITSAEFKPAEQKRIEKHYSFPIEKLKAYISGDINPVNTAKAIRGLFKRAGIRASVLAKNVNIIESTILAKIYFINEADLMEFETVAAAVQ